MKLLLLTAILIIGLLHLVSSLEIELSCPDEVNVNEDFVCSLQIINGNGSYDVKFEIKNEEKNVGRILDNGEWKSTYYYVKNLLHDSNKEDFTLQITQDGTYESSLKIKQASKTESFNFTIKANAVEIIDTNTTQEEDTNNDDSTIEEKESTKDNQSDIPTIEKVKRVPIKEPVNTKDNTHATEKKITMINLNPGIITGKAISQESTSTFKKNSLISFLPSSILIILLILLVTYLWGKL